MNDDTTSSDISTDTDGQQADRFTEPSGGPEPTPAESDAADRSADQVDVKQVGENYRDMTEKGRTVEGEGAV